MLWYKGWLETRIRVAIALALVGFFLIFLSSHPPTGGHGPGIQITPFMSMSVIWIFALLAGAGIATQPAFQATKGIHGSSLFTLSLPVKRLRLLAVRSALGWLESAAVLGVLCCGVWLLTPLLRATATPVGMVEYAATLLACGSAVYCLSVLLSTFLDEQWRVWGTMIAFFAWSWLSARKLLPAFADIFSAMGKASPLVTHTLPWSTMAFSAGLSAVLFFAALQIAQAREY